MLMVMLSLVFIQFSGAWFTATDTKVTNTQTANVGVQIYYGESIIGSNAISISNAKNISIKNTSNINVYIRAKLILNCVDSYGHILTNLNANDYVSITTSNFVLPNGYDQNFVYYYNTQSEQFCYLASGSSIDIVLSNNISRLQETPSGVDVQLSVFAEAIQKDNTDLGLSKWEV